MINSPFQVIDLTHPLSPATPTWNGSCGFCLEIKKDYDCTFRVQQIKMHAGLGTHMDAPSHQFSGEMSIADIPVEKLIVPACVIDVTDRMNPDYLVSVEDVARHEAVHGAIPEGSLVIAYTGWSQFFTDPVRYRNVDANGQMHFPAFSADAAKLLLQRDVAGIAIDTLSPDCLDNDFPVHRLLLEAGKYIIENIADCARLPPRGAYVIALPLRMRDATESPIRIVALIQSHRRSSQ